MIGCGGRATGAAVNCLDADPGVEIVAMGDLVEDRLDSSLKKLKEKFPDRIKVTPETMFTGFDNYKKVLACDVNLIVTATPPHFRPIHLKAAIEAGKHVFIEKPVAVDPVGVRSVIASSELAEKKGLAIVAGTQRRHQAKYLAMMQKIHDGAIGEVVGGQCYWNTGGLWVKKQTEGMSDMEWQCRNWLYFTWLSGDHIVEQHIHNIDVINWAFGTHPVSAMGMGGREVRTGAEYGNIFDHFAIEFEYPNGARVLSMCRQTDGCSNRVSERIVGTKGSAYGDGRIKGENSWKYDGPQANPYVVEHKDLIASIRSGKPLNEGKRVAESNLCAIMGRMSAYTGRALNWDWAMKSSMLDLAPAKYEFGPLPVAPVAVPGKTQLI
jgi:predicted dehydrogenase